jgi:23S rRNA (guanine745-N1)-methyltransferase
VGDSAEMVRARAEFLRAGHFEPLYDAIGRNAAADPRPEVIAELGSGTGALLALLGQRLAPAAAYGFDLSKEAVARAARAHPELTFAVADVEEHIPLGDATVDLAVSAFAPRPAGGLARTVKPGGTLVVTMATERHLAELRQRLDLIGVHPAKLEQLGVRLAPAFRLDEAELVEYELALSPEDARRAVLMGPNARHVGEMALPDEPLPDRVSVRIARFRRV